MTCRDTRPHSLRATSLMVKAATISFRIPWQIARWERRTRHWMTQMTTFVLIPGAGGVAWYWHRLLPLVEQAGHEALAVDLPGDDAHAGLDDYADLVVASIGRRENVTLVAQSMGG